MRTSMIDRACRGAIEPLEDRLLLAVFANINFQPSASPVPPGYFVDSGLAFGDRGNGFTYGWWYAPLTGTPPAPSNPQPANNPATRDRNSGNFIDQRYDTLNHFHKELQSPGSNNEAVPTWWEINVPNGTYRIRVVGGDADNVDNVIHMIAEADKVNGIPQENGSGVELMNANLNGTTGVNRWADSGVKTVTVTDGNLTISEGPAAANNKICFIDIETDVVNPPPASPTGLQVLSTAASKVDLKWNDLSNNENGFRIETSPDGAAWTELTTVGPNTSAFTVAGLQPQTPYHFRVFAFNTVGDSAQPTNSVNTTTAAATGSFLTTFLSTSGDVNLSAGNPLDWVHWGSGGATSVVRKSGVTPQISDVTLLPGSPRGQTTTAPTTFSWSDGTPTASATATPNHLHTFGFDHGFSFTVPADTTRRVLAVYVGVTNFRGQLTARLSDGSAADVVDSSMFSTTPSDGVFGLSYQAGSPNQTLTVTWMILPPNGDPTATASRIGLKAAVLQTPPPVPAGAINSLAVQALNSGRIGLAWQDQTTGELFYTVERASDNGGSAGTFVPIGQATGLSFLDGNVQPNTRYHYRVIPTNFGGNGTTSNAAAATTATGPFGTGAQATFYDDPDFDGPNNNDTKNPTFGAPWPTSVVHPTINFNFGGNAPNGSGAGFGAESFAVRWTLKVKPEFSGLYTFATDTDDGARVIVNGVKVIDALDRRGGLLNAPQHIGTPVQLEAGQQYDVTFDMVDTGGNAGARLYWGHANVPMEIIPQAVMTPLPPDTTPPTITSLQVDTRLPATATYTPQQHLLIKFSETVGGFDADDIQIFDAASGAFVAVGASHMTVAYDSASTTAVVTFHDVPGSGDFIPDGNYTILIPGDTFSDAGGNPSAAEFRQNFYVYQGDTQLDARGNPKPDRKVDFVDYQRLQANFGRANPSHGDGDFNHDGQVNNADFLILQSRFGTSLAPPPAQAPAPAPVPARAASRPVAKTPVAKVAAVAAPVKVTPKFASRRIAGNRDLFN